MFWNDLEQVYHDWTGLNCSTRKVSLHNSCSLLVTFNTILHMKMQFFAIVDKNLGSFSDVNSYETDVTNIKVEWDSNRSISKLLFAHNWDRHAKFCMLLSYKHPYNCSAWIHDIGQSPVILQFDKFFIIQILLTALYYNFSVFQIMVSHACKTILLH